MAALLFDTTDERFVLHPLKSPVIYDAFQKLRDVFWTAAEVDILPSEISQFQAMKEEERNVILKILAFFANADNVVLGNLMDCFCTEVKLSEAKLFYSFQAANEAVHSEMYSLLINAYVTDAAEKTQIFRSIITDPIVQRKTDFATAWLKSEAPFSERAVAFACIEGILFSSSFAFVFYFKKKGVLPALTLSNEFISRDEKQHADFAVLLCNLFDDYSAEADPHATRPSDQTILHIVQEAVEIECDFVDSCLETDLIGLSADQMKQYVKHVADRLLQDLRCEKFYQASQPLQFMESMSLDTRANFFESRNSQYQKATNDDDDSDDDDF